MIEIGTVLQDRFLIEEQIGIGGMGAVYRAVDQKFGTAVAVKETFYRDKELAEAFEREARLLNGLHHPLFPHVSDHFTEGEGHFLVMEFIEGEDLSELLKRGERFPFETVIGWTRDLLDGLDYLHSQDPPIIHRDIKPSNLRRTSRGNIVLLDFGMAKETSGNTLGMRSVFGYSRRYSPLEQIEGTGTDVRSDIFSLGATIYHLVTGTPPVDVLRRASAIVSGRPDPIQSAAEVHPDVPERLAKILESALALNPESRFASARAMWSAFEHSLDGKPELSIPVAPLIAPGSVPNDSVEELPPPAEGFPALEAFEAEVEAEAAEASSGVVFRAASEGDDPIAALVAQRVAQMKAAEPELVREEPATEHPRIEVPVIAFSEEPALVELWKSEPPADDRKDDTFAIPVHADPPVAAYSRNRFPLIAGAALLLLILGLTGYALLRNSSGSDVGVGQPTVEQTATQPDVSPSLSTPAASTEPANFENVVAETDRPEGSPVVGPEVPPKVYDATRAERAPRPQESVQQPVDRESFPARQGANSVRDQAKTNTSATKRNTRSTRPRVVDEEDFEQPPVSSIESIMTGIPNDRPRQPRRWEVIEDDQLRRERRLRRIERRNRQRWPLF